MRDLFHQLGDGGREGLALHNTGFTYDDLGQYRQALTFYEQALPLRRETGDRDGEAETLNNIGLDHHDLGQYPQALEFLQQALAIRREVKDSVNRARPPAWRSLPSSALLRSAAKTLSSRPPVCSPQRPTLNRYVRRIQLAIDSVTLYSLVVLNFLMHPSPCACPCIGPPCGWDVAGTPSSASGPGGYPA